MKEIMFFVCLWVWVNAVAQNTAAEDTIAKPAITTVGKPDGEKREMKIGKDGGSLLSSDGKTELIIPEGAVSKKTMFSIQPITSTITNANGKAYRLQPSGIQFQKPVQLVFNYDEEDAKDTMQLLMGIAMQDEKGQWYSLKKFTLDTIAKTLSGSISHFSDWSKFDALKLEPASARLKINTSIKLTITGMQPSPEDEGDGELVKLERKPKKTIWSVNGIKGGNASVGKLQFANSFTIGNGYTAPAQMPSQNPVEVAVKLEGLTWFPNGVKGASFNNLRIVSNILIYDNAYEIKMISSMDGMAGSQLGKVTYQDTGSFVIAVNGKDTRIIEKLNKNATDKLDYQGRCEVKQLRSGSGNIHIIAAKSIKLIPPVTPGGNAWVEIEFIRAPSIFPLLQFKCPPVGKGDWTTDTNAKGNAFVAMMPAFPQRVKFEAKEGLRMLEQIGGPGQEIFYQVIIKKLADD